MIFIHSTKTNFNIIVVPESKLIKKLTPISVFQTILTNSVQGIGFPDGALIYIIKQGKT